MRYSQLLLKTTKESKQFDSINATLLIKGGFIDQTMAGVYTFLPLGWRVLNKIENIVREEMDAIGAEMLMPTLSPRSLWEQTNRTGFDVLFEARGANKASLAKNDTAFIINPTHEELITPIVQKMKPSYKDLPFGVYQIQTKFRNEERPKSGLLRGREFRMKDLYSFHVSLESMQEYYEKAKEVYMNVFRRVGLGDDTYIVRASGGDFTKDFSHEFQTVCESGEDTIYVNDEGDGWNKEVATEEVQSSYTQHPASEVGNIFPLGTKFTKAFNYHFRHEDGQEKPVYMASYGIGTSRIMGVLVEKFHDERGIIWPDSVAPYTVYLAGLNGDDETIRNQADGVYKALQKAGIDVLYDDRNVSPGDKFGDADLLGIPWRVVVSKKTGGQIEVKRRTEQDNTLMSAEEFIKQVTN
ncbi:MAG: aminoacyl--tRNA ligase-related protein [Candidatus Andersenbacteria bacterium]